MEKENKSHNKKVIELKRILLDLNLPILPLNTVKSTFYTPDIVTRINTKFIPIDFINSKGQFTFDIGGLALVYNKDIVDFCLAILDDKLWEGHLRDFKLAKLNLPPRLNLIPFKEVGEYVTSLLGYSRLELD